MTRRSRLRRRTTSDHRRTVRGAATAVAFGIALALGATSAASAAPVFSGEIGGGSASARLQASALRDSWLAALADRSLPAPAPLVLTTPIGDPISGVSGTTPGGTTVAIERLRYSADAADPVLVGGSSNPGTAACTGSGLTLPGSAPRPSVLAGNTGCTNGTGVSYSEFGGVGESTTRDAIEFTFSRPVIAFGAWFGDLETRTAGGGVAALMDLHAEDGTRISRTPIAPVGDQSACANTVTACGNSTTRWVGLLSEAGEAVSRVVIIVGDEDAAGTALDEGISFIGMSVSDPVPTVGAVLQIPDPVNAAVGDVIAVPVEVSNPGPTTLTGLGGVVCPAAELAAGSSMTCTLAHPVTQTDLDAGGFDVAAAVTAESWGVPAVPIALAGTVVLIQSPAFTIALTADRSEFTLVGDVIRFSAVVTNTGNVTATPTAELDDGTPLSCEPTGSLAPGEPTECTALTAAPSAADVVAHATATWASGSTNSADVIVRYVAPPIPTIPEATPELSATGADLPIGGVALALGLAVAGIALTRIARRCQVRGFPHTT
jgi:uncharacterized repeat protein (TIGR01451 family)